MTLSRANTFTIHIEIAPSSEPSDVQENLLAAHRAWFAHYFKAGNFLVVGPYRDLERAGFILAQAPDRRVLEEILAQDAYYQNGATYTVHEVTAKMVADNILDYRE